MGEDVGRLRFRLLALLQVVGGLFVLAFAVFPTPTTRPIVDVVVGSVSIALGALTWLVLPRLPGWATHVSVAASTVVTGVLVYLMATDQGQVFSSYGFVMVGAFAATFFAWRGLAWHLVLITVAWLGACALNPVIASAVIPIVITAIIVLLSVAFHVITERARSAGERLSAVWQSQIDPFLLLDGIRDPHGTLVDLAVSDVNDAAARAANLTRQQMVGRTILSLVPQAPDHGPFQLFLEALETGEPVILNQFEYADPFQNGVRAYDVRAFRAGRSLAVTWADVTEESRAQREVTRLARSDDLTGFLNRRAGLEHLAGLLAAATPTSRVAVLFCDVDNFKDVNDEHGHEVGDEVLRLVADQVRHALRHDDIVVRAGGDEFLVVLQDLQSSDAALVLAEKIRAAVEQPLPSRVGELRVGLSVGVVEARPGESIDEVVARADRAMYDAKHQGRGRVVRG